MDERGASVEFQQDQAEAAEQAVTRRKDKELERMMWAIPSGWHRDAYITEVVAIVRRHNAELVADLARKRVLIDHLEELRRCPDPSVHSAPKATAP